MKEGTHPLSLRYHVRTLPTLSCSHSRFLQWSIVVSFITYPFIMRSAHWNEHDFTKLRRPINNTAPHSSSFGPGSGQISPCESVRWAEWDSIGMCMVINRRNLRITRTYRLRGMILRTYFDGGALTLGQESIHDG